VGETQNSLPSNAELKNVWRCTSNPLGGVHMDYGCGDKREQVTGGQRNLQNVEFKLSFAIVVITINNEAWWAGLAESGGWRADWCGD